MTDVLISHNPARFERLLERLYMPVAVALAFGLFTYVVYRAVWVGFTGDEAQSLFNIRSALEGDPEALLTANTHPLNSLWMAFAELVIGDSELIMRLPALAGHLLYLSAMAIFFRRLGSPALALSGLIVVNANPFMLEYFGLARGYSLALGLMALSLAFFCSGFDKVKQDSSNQRRIEVGFLLMSVSVFANFTMLYVLIAAGVVFLWKVLADRHQRGESFGTDLLFGSNAPLGRVILVGLVTIALFAPIYIALSVRGELYYGDYGGNVLRSVAFLLTLASAEWFKPTSVVIFGMLGIASASGIFVTLRGREALPAMVLLAAATLIVVSLFKIVLGSPLPIERTALFLWPVCIMALFSGAALCDRSRLVSILGGAAAVLLLTNLAVRANIEKTTTFGPEMGMEELVRAAISHQPDRPILVNWSAVWTARYYASRMSEDVRVEPIDHAWCIQLRVGAAFLRNFGDYPHCERSQPFRVEELPQNTFLIITDVMRPFVEEHFGAIHELKRVEGVALYTRG